MPQLQQRRRSSQQWTDAAIFAFCVVAHNRRTRGGRSCSAATTGPAGWAPTPVPCVVYCHCNSGSRRDAEEALHVLLLHDIGVFCLDFAVRRPCTSLNRPYTYVYLTHHQWGSTLHPM